MEMEGTGVSDASTGSNSSRAPREWLRAESALWRAEGLITPEQQAAILARYPAEKLAGRGRTTGVIITLGALLIGLSVILFIAHNWWQIPIWLKLSGILALVLAAHGLGYWLWQVRGTYPRSGHAMVLLGCVLYGAGIWLVAQIFHLESHWPNGFLLWALGSLPVAWVLRSRPVLALSALLLAVWSAVEQTGFGQASWLYPLLALVAVAPLAYRLQAVEAVGLKLAGLTFWTVANAVRWADGAGWMTPYLVFLTVGLLGTAVLSAGLLHRLRPNLAGLALPFLTGGAGLSLTGAYLLTLRIERYRTDFHLLPSWQTWTLVGVLAALTLVLLVVIARPALLWPDMAAARAPDDGRPAGRAEAMFTQPAIAIAVFALALFTGVIPADGVQALITNLLLFTAALGMVAWGFRTQAAAFVNLGLLAFVAQVITRYFDFFYSLLERSLFFMVGGAILLGGGMLLERWRRLLLKGGVAGE